MRYLPHTESEIRDMLSRIGVKSIDELFSAIPESRRQEGLLAIDAPLDEASLMDHVERLSAKNDAVRSLSFLGGGIYDHHIPPAVDQLLLRSEFYTAYTPYQAEVSQGTLQATFEFQTMVCELLGLDVANASVYDGASAVAEAILMARRVTKRGHSVISGALHPEYLQTAETYLSGLEDKSTLDVAPTGADGRTDLVALKSLLTEDTSCIVLGYPNFFGCVEDLEAARELADSVGALLITATAEPYALSLLRSPGSFGVDIAVGEGQAMAVPPQFGGPGVGLFACKTKLMRQLPGRLVGQTVDQDGKTGYVLTLNTREQHIRRERATSNICTNQGLVALAFAIRTALLGRRGFEQVGKLCLSRTQYLKSAIDALPGFSVLHSAPTFNEFVVRRHDGKAAPLLAALAAEGILAGIDLGRHFVERDHEFLVNVTERHGRSDLDRLVEALSRM